MSIREAMTRYVAARKEYLAAAEMVRVVIDVDARAVLTRVSRLTQRRRTWREADELGERVHTLKRERPELTQAEVAGELGLSRHMVNYYLHSPKHAAKTSA